MNPLEEKENVGNQEETKEIEEEKKEEENQEEEKKEEEKEPSAKEGVVEGDLLNLGGEGDGDSSSEAKHRDKEGSEEKKEEEKEGEEENKEELNSEQQKETFKSVSNEEDNENKEEEIKNSQNMGSKINEEKTREKTFKNVKTSYKYQLNQIRNLFNFKQIYDKFWKLLPHTFEGEISKSSFISLYSKILKVLLPLFNYPQINKFCDGLWIKYTKGKNPNDENIVNFLYVTFKKINLSKRNLAFYLYV